MANVQELTEYLHSVVESYNKLIDHLAYYNSDYKTKDFKQQQETIVNTANAIIDNLFNTYAAHLQTLAYILDEHFDGEYIMGAGDMQMDLEGYNFFADYIVSDDGSVKVVGWKEKQ